MKSAAQAWTRFWFQPESTATLALVRIAFGVLVLLWAISLGPDLRLFFSTEGLVPTVPDGEWWVSVFDIESSWTVVVATYVLLLVGAVGLTVGWWTRLSALVVFLATMSLTRRAPYVFNSGDMLFRHFALFLLLAPAGASLSLDRWRRHRGDVLDHAHRAPWALRLMQVELVIVYVGTVWAKVRGTEWNDGTAISYALRIGDITRFELPDRVLESELISGVLTYGTLAVEALVPILIWSRRTRPYAIAAGLLLHAFIELTVEVGFFSLLLGVAYLAFVPAESAEGWITRRATAARAWRATRRSKKPAAATAR